MILSKKDLLEQARKNFFKPDIFEKVIRLLDILEAFASISFLKDRLVLKGGTALNLFHFESLPRLSVDIDLNYVGSLDKNVMIKEREIINEVIHQILHQKGCSSDRNPKAYAGGKMIWKYDSLLGQKGNLEIDLNYMYREPLLEKEWKHPIFKSEKNIKIPVLNIHELAAGKLTALFDRHASRDLFDAHNLLTRNVMSIDILRPIWVVYLAISDIPLKKLFLKEIEHDVRKAQNELLPVLFQNHNLGKKADFERWLQKILEELKEKLSNLVPLSSSEDLFIQKIRNEGIIEFQLITKDQALGEKIQRHPGILWATSKNR